MQFIHNMPEAGSATLMFRYNLASGSQNMTLRVNGVDIAGGLTFNSTGGNWAEVSVAVSLLQGANTIRSITNGQSMPLLDEMTVS